MQFYRYNGLMTNEQWAEENENRRVLRERIRSISMRSEEFNQRQQRKAYCFVSDASDDMVNIGIIMKVSGDVEKLASEYLRQINIELRDTSFEEITFCALQNMLGCASRYDYIEDDDEVLEAFDLDKLVGRFGRTLEFGENILEEHSKMEVYEATDRFLAKDSFISELDRIYIGGTSKKISGHPVHYMIYTDDPETRKEMCRTLLQALYANNRVRNKRYCFLDFRSGESFSQASYDCLYKSCIGGAILVRYLAMDDTEDDHASGERYTIENLCEIMKKYQNQVLTVFCLPRECTKSKDIFYENIGNVSIIELKEDFVSGERAEDFLKLLAKEQGIRTDKKLFAKLEADKAYLAVDLREVYSDWYNNKLKTKVYPQYKDITTARREVIKAAPKGSAYDELNRMTGLDEAKKVIHQALNYYKAQKLFSEKGMKRDHPAMHMIFTGNPGTAKTTAARLFARIMQENDLLSKGKLIEVGRGDLVGKYVGWTASIVKKKFKEAEGSVLFIDEAYSLVDDRNGSFGDEAINTIVQEMENNRDNVVVIFAGYPDKMEEFLQKNPGLRSRIAFHVPFDDYDTASLCEIARHIAKEKGLELTKEAVDKLVCVFDQARTEGDFGNGRYVRNIIEKARMAQATRLLAMDFDAVKKADITTIRAEDIEMPQRTAKPEKLKIGFCA